MLSPGRPAPPLRWPCLPFLPEGTPLIWFRLGYSALFFGAAFLVALRPEKLTSRLGRLLCPLLLALVAVMFLGCLIHPVGGYGPALPPMTARLRWRAFSQAIRRWTPLRP